MMRPWLIMPMPEQTLGYFHGVGGEDNGATIGHVVQQHVFNQAGGSHIQGRTGLIQNDQLRVVD